MDEGELSLRDLFQILKPYQRSLILTPLLFGVMALAVTFMMTPRYEASGIIQIAQLNTAILEPSSVMIARMNSPSFRAQLEILIPNELSHTNKTEFNSLRVKKVKDTELVAFEVQGRTPERALLKADAVVRNLQKTHARIYSANINNIQTQLDQINSQIDQLHQESKLVNNKLSQQRDLNNYTAVLYLLSMQDKASQFKQLTERKLALESSLNPAFYL